MNDQERRDDPAGGTAVGIDPGALNQLIADARAAIGEIEQFTGTYRSRFNQAGVTTTNISRQEVVAEWVNDQLPMLERRRDMAEIAAEGPPGTFVAVGAGDLGWDTADEAAKAGREDAERLLEGLHPGDEIPDEVYALLREHSFDPDYLEAFFNSTGSAVLAIFLQDAYQGSGEYDSSKLGAVSFALAAASHRIDMAGGEWMRGMDNWGDVGWREDDGWTTMAQFMGYGRWNEDFLHSAMDNLHRLDDTGTITVMEALARHPVAAATWFQGSPSGNHRFDTNAEYAAAIMQGWAYGESVHEAFLKVLDAATEGVARFDQGLADKSVYLLLKTVHDMDDKVAQEMYRLWFTHLIERHLDDLYDSVTAPVEEYYKELRDGRDGVEAPAEWWASIVEQAMRDETNAAYLSVRFQEKFVETHEYWGGSTDSSNRDANNFPLAQANLFADWFVCRSANVAETLNKEVDEWNEMLGAAIDLLTDPKHPKELALDIGKDIANGLLKDLLSRPYPDYDPDVGWTELEHRMWLNASVNYHKKRLGDGSLPEVEIVHERDDGTTWTETYDGNPATYEERHGGKFTDDDGRILPISEMDEAGMLAYMEWVQDPAVVDAYWNDLGAHFPNPGVS
ncbi:hypothetical protein [Phytoactinopolyspora limicola]|uniref:hypothetical protein n=1 Tax=Phytoactinopolyspora limicola TaxID=2715536 RepID=UPI0014081D2B|nr:hypothetical protein [Phytoactinopolyspora limicola]